MFQQDHCGDENRGRSDCFQEASPPFLFCHPSPDEDRNARYGEQAKQPAANRQRTLFDDDQLCVLLEDLVGGDDRAGAANMPQPTIPERDNPANSGSLRLSR